MDEVKKRVKLELIALSKRCMKLSAFIRSSKIEKLSKEHQSLLVEQLVTMIRYKELLDRRLSIWEKK